MSLDDDPSADAGQVYFSERFGVNPAVLEAHGALDISIVTDLPLFIDPFLLFNSERPDYQALHQSIVDYLRFLKSKAGAGLSPGLVDALYRFKEIKQNWLGFVAEGNSGHGLGRKFAQELNEALTSLLSDLGDEVVTESTHVEKVSLIRKGVGRDSISDFTTNLAKHFLCSYTEAFTVKHIDPSLRKTFAVARVAFNYNTESWVTRNYTLPNLDGDFVLLTPMDMLTLDDTWINRSDMVRSYGRVAEAVSDQELRAQVDAYLSRQLSSDPTPKQIREAQAMVFTAFPSMVDLYIKIKEDDRAEATSVSAAKTKDTKEVLVDQVKAAAADIAAKTDLFATPWTSLDEAETAVTIFKHYVENQDGYTLINRGGGKPFASEREVQTFFGLLLAPSRFDVNREPNNGRGPVDFKISNGSLDKSLIEFKLASSTSLKRNLEKQVEIYEKANKTNQSMKVIIAYTDADIAKVTKVLAALGMSSNPAVVVVDARTKPSASTV
jgi:flagellin-like hook-associated protein FlgL